MEELGIKPSAVLRKAIEEEVNKKKMEKIKLALKEMKPVLDRVSMDEVVKGIREDRDTR